MALCHVTIIGRDRPHLQALGRKLRVIVVGYVEDKRGAVVVPTCRKTRSTGFGGMAAQ